MLAFVALVTAVESFRSDELRNGFGLLGLGLLCVSAMLAFTWPTRCRVITARGRECTKEAGGVLFGCSAGRHRYGKFAARLGLNGGSDHAQAQPRTQSAATHHLATEDALAIVVTVAGGGMGICAFWFGLISTAAGVASVALAAAQLH